MNNKKIIAVLFADNKPSVKIIREIKRARFDGILIDTKNKKNGNLRNYLNIKKLEIFIKVSKKENLTTVQEKIGDNQFVFIDIDKSNSSHLIFLISFS